MDCLTEQPFCRTEQRWMQTKNTGLITDALGPFPDEPLFSAVDKTLVLFCDCYCALNCPGDPTAALCSSGVVTDRCSAEIKTCPSKVSFVKISVDKKCPRQLNISSSCSKLTELTKRNLKPCFDCLKPKNKAIKFDQEDSKAKDKQWVETKTTCNGIKSYEFWSKCQKCPSVVFIVPPSGEAISFQRVE